MKIQNFSSISLFPLIIFFSFFFLFSCKSNSTKNNTEVDSDFYKGVDCFYRNHFDSAFVFFSKVEPKDSNYIFSLQFLETKKFISTKDELLKLILPGTYSIAYGNVWDDLRLYGFEKSIGLGLFSNYSVKLSIDSAFNYTAQYVSSRGYKISSIDTLNVKGKIIIKCNPTVGDPNSYLSKKERPSVGFDISFTTKELPITNWKIDLSHQTIMLSGQLRRNEDMLEFKIKKACHPNELAYKKFIAMGDSTANRLSTLETILFYSIASQYNESSEKDIKIRMDKLFSTHYTWQSLNNYITEIFLKNNVTNLSDLFTKDSVNIEAWRQLDRNNFENMILSSNDNWLGYLGIGLINFINRNYKTAIENYILALKTKPDLSKILLNKNLWYNNRIFVSNSSIPGFESFIKCSEFSKDKYIANKMNFSSGTFAGTKVYLIDNQEIEITFKGKNGIAEPPLVEKLNFPEKDGTTEVLFSVVFWTTDGNSVSGPSYDIYSKGGSYYGIINFIDHDLDYGFFTATIENNRPISQIVKVVK